ATRTRNVDVAAEHPATIGRAASHSHRSRVILVFKRLNGQRGRFWIHPGRGAGSTRARAEKSAILTSVREVGTGMRRGVALAFSPAGVRLQVAQDEATTTFNLPGWEGRAG